MKKHKEVLKITLKRLATIANVFTPKGISLRFLNYDKDNGGDFDALSAEDIEKKFNTVEYKSGSQLGTRLKEKIITPILKKAQRGELKKPIIVMLITDGKVSRFNYSYPVYICSHIFYSPTKRIVTHLEMQSNCANNLKLFKN